MQNQWKSVKKICEKHDKSAKKKTTHFRKRILGTFGRLDITLEVWKPKRDLAKDATLENCFVAFETRKH